MMTSEKLSMQELLQDSYLSGGSADYIEELYEAYLKNPNSIEGVWRIYFDGLRNGKDATTQDVSHAEIREYFLNLAKHSTAQVVVQGADLQHEYKQQKVIELIQAYRSFGHLRAKLDPLGLWNGPDNRALDLAHYGFTEADKKTLFDVDEFNGLPQRSSLSDIYDALTKTYSGTIGFEFMHIDQSEELVWLQRRIERSQAKPNLSKETKLHVLQRLIAANDLEKYLGFKYVGQKRFSLEGGDSLIPLMDRLITRSQENGVKEVIIGMAHRGRLNVLVNVIGKATGKVFSEFEGKDIPETHSGDVKYHMGYSSNVVTKQGLVHVALAFNPSHLEIVAPVVQGSVRARQRRRRDKNRNMVLPIQIHGDAAFPGQGVVMETFSMSQTRWFNVGGSIHLVINNQVGFTISNPQDARSTWYCTDVAKMVQAPIIHVNGDDPEAVIFAAELAIDYRSTFKKDIVIDLVCYRRHGHNEMDEPSATQPVMYKIIKEHAVPARLYAEKLIQENVIDQKHEEAISAAYRELLDAGESVVEVTEEKSAYEYSASWNPFIGQEWTVKADTRVPAKRLQALAKSLEKLPENFVVQPQVKKVLEDRKKMTSGELPLNWGYAEALAFATLLDEGYPIRLCGQDSARGTFSHRHSVLFDQNTGNTYIPLTHVSERQVQINIVDSLLSEEGVLAFEYGYATTEPNNLVIWEAQYGDFMNGAQVVIDQFISSGEQKWGRLCGLIMFLPHGYEGAGPEHSSARLERFLQLSAQHNLQICVPTTPAQIFHLLRRQMLRPYRKPLVVMSPKSILRNSLAVSKLDDLANGQFEVVIPEIDDLDEAKVTRVVFCSGKVYYDLLAKRRAESLKNVALIRIEQLYPFPEKRLREVLKSYSHAKDIVWCQEEPKNQGAWYSSQHHLTECIGAKQRLHYAGREASASPAVGYPSVHAKEQEALVKQALY